MQDTPHKENINKGGDDETSKKADKDTPEEDVHHTQLTSPTEWIIYNLRPRKPRNHTGVDSYAHPHIVHYTMTKYSLRKGLNKFKKLGEAEVEKSVNQLHMNSTVAPMNVANMSEK